MKKIILLTSVLLLGCEKPAQSPVALPPSSPKPVETSLPPTPPQTELGKAPRMAPEESPKP